jgi:hypothetical protein
VAIPTSIYNLFEGPVSSPTFEYRVSEAAVGRHRQNQSSSFVTQVSCNQLTVPFSILHIAPCTSCCAFTPGQSRGACASALLASLHPACTASVTNRDEVRAWSLGLPPR